jgi:hypothetical protein
LPASPFHLIQDLKNQSLEKFGKTIGEQEIKEDKRIFSKKL